MHKPDTCILNKIQQGSPAYYKECCRDLAREITAEVASTLMSRRALGRARQNLLNIMGRAVGRAECGSRPAVSSELTCGRQDMAIVIPCIGLCALVLGCEKL